MKRTAVVIVGAVLDRGGVPRQPPVLDDAMPVNDLRAPHHRARRGRSPRRRPRPARPGARRARSRGRPPRPGRRAAAPRPGTAAARPARCWRCAPPRPARPSRRPRRTRSASDSGETCERPECRSRWPSASLASLPMPPATVSRGTGWRRRYLSTAPAKSPMSSSASSGSPYSSATTRSLVLPGAAGDVLVTGGPGDVDAAADRVDPRRARVRDDDAGRARGSTARRGCRAAGSRSSGPAPRRAPRRSRPRRRRCRRARAATARDVLAHELPRHRVDRRLADRPAAGRAWSPCRRPAPARKATPLPGSPCVTARGDQRAVGDVRVVAGVLDDARAWPRRPPAARAASAKDGCLSVRQVDRHRVGELAGEQRGVGGGGGGGRAGAGRPAVAQPGAALPAPPWSRDQDARRPRGDRPGAGPRRDRRGAAAGDGAGRRRRRRAQLAGRPGGRPAAAARARCAIGGFGGADGLAAWLQAHRCGRWSGRDPPVRRHDDRLSGRGRAGATGVPLLRLQRPGWTPQPGDDWRWVDSLAEAAPRRGRVRPVFLTTGRQGLAAFAGADRRAASCGRSTRRRRRCPRARRSCSRAARSPSRGSWR